MAVKAGKRASALFLPSYSHATVSCWIEFSHMQKSSSVLEIEILVLSPLPYKKLHINYQDLKTNGNKAWTSLVAQLIICLQCRGPWFNCWAGKIPWRRDRPPIPVFLASLVAQLVKNPPAMRETWVGKIPWRRVWLSTPVFLLGESPWIEEPGGLQSLESQRVGHDWTIKDKHTIKHIKYTPQTLLFIFCCCGYLCFYSSFL